MKSADGKLHTLRYTQPIEDRFRRNDWILILIGKSPLLFIVNPKVPAKTITEFVALAKAP